VVVQDLNFVEQSYYQEAGVTSWASQSPPVGASMPQPSGAQPPTLFWSLLHINLPNLAFWQSSRQRNLRFSNQSLVHLYTLVVPGSKYAYITD